MVASHPEGSIASERRTSLGLYLTAREAYDRWQEDPDGVRILDCRTKEEYVFVGHPPTAVNIPFAFQSFEWDAERQGFHWELNADFMAAVRHWARRSCALPLRYARKVRRDRGGRVSVNPLKAIFAAERPLAVARRQRRISPPTSTRLRCVQASRPPIEPRQMLANGRLADGELVGCDCHRASADVRAQHLELPPGRALVGHQPALRYAAGHDLAAIVTFSSTNSGRDRRWAKLARPLIAPTTSLGIRSYS